MGTLFYLFAAQGILLGCIVAVFLTTIAELIYVPLYQSLAIQLYNNKNSVRALGILGFIWGLSESIATFVGLYLVAHGLGIYSFCLGALAALFSVVLYKTVPQKRPVAS